MRKKTIKISKKPQLNWENDSIQFPRLLAEINMVCPLSKVLTPTQMNELCESMDLQVSDINEIFSRAQDTWDKIKSRT